MEYDDYDDYDIEAQLQLQSPRTKKRKINVRSTKNFVQPTVSIYEKLYELATVNTIE